MAIHAPVNPDHEPVTAPEPERDIPWYQKKVVKIGGAVAGILAVVGTGIGVGSSMNNRPAGPAATYSAPANPNTSPTPTSSETQEQVVNPLSSEHLWSLNNEERSELIRSMFPESMVKDPELFVKTKVAVTDAIYGMAGDQAAYDVWQKANPTSTNEDWADYITDSVLVPAFNTLDGKQQTDEQRKGIWNMAARGGLVTMARNIMSQSNGSPIELPEYTVTGDIHSVEATNVTKDSFDVTVKMDEGDTLTKDVIAKINAITGQDWKINGDNDGSEGHKDGIGGYLEFEWANVHYDPAKKMVLQQSTTDIVSD